LGLLASFISHQSGGLLLIWLGSRCLNNVTLAAFRVFFFFTGCVKWTRLRHQLTLSDGKPPLILQPPRRHARPGDSLSGGFSPCSASQFREPTHCASGSRRRMP
jgi:hypothetical protein